MKRRSFLIGLGAVLAAPAIVDAENIMRIARLRKVDFDRRLPQYCTGLLFDHAGHVAGGWFKGCGLEPDPDPDEFVIAIHRGNKYATGLHQEGLAFPDNFSGSQKEIEAILWHHYPDLRIQEKGEPHRQLKSLEVYA